MSDRLHNTLGAERARLGWSQSRMAAEAGISRQSYAAIESGASVPSTEIALRLAAAVGRPVGELFRLPERSVERRTARWSGAAAPTTGARVRLIRIAGRWIAHPCAEAHRSGQPADGVVEGVGGSARNAGGAGGVGEGAAAEPMERDGGGHGVESGPRATGVTGTGGRADADGIDVTIRPVPDGPPRADLAVVGCDPGFGILADALNREAGIQVSWSQRGSRGALDALARGEAHVAGVHLHDRASGLWNAPQVRALVPFPCTRIAFAVWEQGLLVRPDARRRIGGVGDLADGRARLLNREEGSGSRALLDEALAAAGVAPAGVVGYATAARGHLAVAEGIAAGAADAGVAIRAAGLARGLSVLPLRQEAYELVVPDHFLELPAVDALLALLRRPGIRGQVEALGGYDGEGMGRVIG